jgi:hypothetical protein
MSSVVTKLQAVIGIDDGPKEAIARAVNLVVNYALAITD